jgi:hypothetical protein
VVTYTALLRQVCFVCLISELLGGTHTSGIACIKSPHAGSLEDDCRKDIANEAKIYLHLDEHARLVPMICYIAKDGLCLEYMPNGDLRDYTCRYNGTARGLGFSVTTTLQKPPRSCRSLGEILPLGSDDDSTITNIGPS